MLDEQTISRTDCLEVMRAAGREMPSLRAMDASMLPGAVQTIARLIGLPATLKLVEDFGGLTLRLPIGAREAGRIILDELSRSIGQGATKILAKHYAATPLYVPNCKPALINARDAALVGDRTWLAARGLPERRIVQCLALRYGISERHVWTILKKPQPKARPEPKEQLRSGNLLDCLDR